MESWLGQARLTDATFFLLRATPVVIAWGYILDTNRWGRVEKEGGGQPVEDDQYLPKLPKVSAS